MYGSYARRAETSESDVDIAVLFHGEAPGFTVHRNMSIDLMKKLDLDIDLVFMSEVSCILQMQIFKYGRMVLCNDSVCVNRFIVKTLKEYFDLKRIRRPIERKLKNVTIYG